MINRKNIISKLFFLIPLVFLILIYRNLFFPSYLSSGDFIYYYPSSIKTVQLFGIWDARHLGMGASNLPTMWIEGPFSVHLQLANLIPWNLYERIFWFWPFFVFSFISSLLLAKNILGKSIFAYLAPIIYATNTYILLMVGGGQMGGAIAYALAPLVILLFKQILETRKGKYSMLSGLIFGVMMMFDIRPSYIIAIILFLQYIALNLLQKNKLLSKDLLIRYFVAPGFIILLLHAYWLLPLAVLHANPIDMVAKEITSLASLKFFSFAKMENTISLLHPNWPENIFGKTSFLPSKYLLLPIFGFLSGLFIYKKEKKGVYVPILMGIALIGIFLAKGVNEPFGGIYLWLFEYVSGFKMFRDPTKWYILIAVAYSVLIPFSLEGISQIKRIKKIRYVKALIFIGFILIWTVLIKDILFSSRGTFGNHPIASEYGNFAKMLEEDTSFSRTLWVPSIHRFGYSSEQHPAVNFQEITKKQDARKYFLKDNHEQELQNRSIEYVVVPIDSDSEIFLKDRKYSAEVRKSYINVLDKASYLQKVNTFKNLAVYRVASPSPLFRIAGNGNITYKRISPTKYFVTVNNINQTSKIVFGQNYDSGWEVNSFSEPIKSVNYQGFNSFSIQKKGSFGFVIEYGPQKWVYYGLVVTTLGLVSSLFILLKK